MKTVLMARIKRKRCMRMKKWLSLLLVVCLVLGLPVSVSAAQTPEHVTYTVMQTASTDTTVTVQLKFSEPVWIRDGNVWLCNHIAPAACNSNQTLWQTGIVSSSPALTSTFQNNYADTYTLTYSRCTDATHTNHYNDWKNGLPSDAMVRIVDLVSQYSGTGLDGKVDEFAFKSQSGKILPAVKADNGMEVAAENVELMPKIVSAQVQDANAEDAVKVLVTFNKPVTRRDATSHVFLCDKYNPNPDNQVTVGGVTYTSWQKSPSNLSYINGTVGADGRTYSNQIMLTFPSPGTPLPATAGIRIVEYNAPASEKNNGEVWSEVVADENGIGLMPTIKDGSVDISWMTVNVAEDAQKIVSISKLSATQVQVNFAMMVKAIDVTDVTVGDVAVTAATRVGGDANGSGTWTLTLGAALGEDDTLLTIPANAVTMAYNGEKVAKVLIASTDRWYGFTETDAVIPLEDKAYNFMNTDTGRSLAVADGDTTVDEFTVVRKSAESNMIALKYGEQYLDLRTATVSLSDEPIYFLIKACANARYQLLVNPDYAVADSDAGTDNCATMTVKSANGKDISTGWYLTPSGETRPIRLLPLGDSLTDGVNYDRQQGELMVSYREELSEMLTEYFGRVVFVGAKKTASTTLDEARLLRHAGYSGYVIRQYWSENTYEQTYQHPGIDPFINDLTAKYDPDIVCMLLGHNDNSQMNMNKVHTGKSKEQLIAEWLVVYEEFVNKITDTMDDNDTIFCSSLTINKDASGTESKKQVNEHLIPMLKDMMGDNGNLALADSWTATATVGLAGINAADSVHLNAVGYGALADEWYRVITEVYGTDSVKKSNKPVETGWKRNEVGWWYLNADGSYPAAQWMYIDNVWYYFNEAGYMVTGWQYIGGTWYYFNGGGAMMTGWVNDGGTWYYMNGGGAMQTGWVLVGDTWYYMNASGAMQTGWLLLGNTWYYLQPSGAMATGWVLDGGTWYYMNASGAMQTGWLLLGNTWYYLNASGAMMTGQIVVDGVTYVMDASGAWVA